MKVGLSLPLTNQLKSKQNAQHAGAVKLNSLQKDTVSFKAYEKEFNYYAIKYANDKRYSYPKLNQVMGWINDIEPQHPLIKKTLTDVKEIISTKTGMEKLRKFAEFKSIEEDIYGVNEIFK